MPIQGLTVPVDWTVGPVRVRPVDDALAELRGDHEANRTDDWFDDLVQEHKTGALAYADAPDIGNAIALVSQAVDVLRLYQHVRYWTTQLTHFGLAGEVGRGVVPYAELESDRPGRGVLNRGDAIGWTFAEQDNWADEPLFHWVAAAIGSTSPTEAQRRALVGVQLLSQGLVEQRDTFKLVSVVTALEAWLLPRRRTSQTYRLARAIAFFGCGRHEGRLCGRDRDTCPYLELDPDKETDRARLRVLRERGWRPPWRCSEWHRVVDWYDERSDIVHGSPPSTSDRAASTALYWVVRQLTEPILQWLFEHPADPTGALEEAMGALPPGPDWETILGEPL